MKKIWVSREPVLASMPIAIHTIGLVVSWLWSPVLFERSDYGVAALVVLAVLIAGAAWGFVQRLPLWSYGWVIFSLGGIGKLAGAVIAGSGVLGFETIRAMSMASLWTSLATFFVVVIVASLLGFRGVRFAMYAILLSMAYGALSFPVLTEWPFVSAGTASVVTSVFALLAVAEAVFAVLVVARFLGAQGKGQIRLLYFLAAIVFVDRLLNGWAISLTVSGGSFWDIVVPAVASIGGAWVSTGITLLLVWGLSKLALRLTGRRTSRENS